MTGTTGVTASVVSHGQRELLASLLADLAAAGAPDLRRLVITLNIDEPVPVLPEIQGCDVRVLRNERPLGFGANQNQAFELCETDWFAVLNPDLRWSADPFGRLLAKAQPGDVLLAPCILEADGHAADSRRRLLTPWQLMLRAAGRRAPVAAADIDWLAGMCLLVRRSAFRDVGGFDPRFFMYCEDADLSLRLQLAGGRLRFVDDVVVTHAAQRDSHRSAAHLRWHITSLLKHCLSRSYWRYLLRRKRLRAGRQSTRPALRP